MNTIKQNKQGLKVLIAGVILQFFLGIIYTWSVFKAPVSVYYKWDAFDVGLTASFMLCFFAVGILLGGKVVAKIGVKLTVLIGGLMVAAGMLATSFIPATGQNSVFWIYFFYGVIGGSGVGAAYNAIISNAQKWFPENRGFATGVSVSAFGFSTVFFAPFIKMLSENLEMNIIFMILSGIFAMATLLLFNFIKSPDQIANASVPVLKGKQYTNGEMLKTTRFYLITLSMMFGTAVFFTINPDLKDLAINRNAASFATVLVMVLGISNALGRLCIPLLSDKIGAINTNILILGATAVGAFLLCFVGGVGLILTISIVAFCYGGTAGLYPVITGDNFGLKNVASNYGLVMIGFMLSALIFPFLIGKIDSQSMKFITLGIIAVMSTVFVIILKIMRKKLQDNE
ncbi:MAG: MFS transporter [Bacteroidales bacterium]|jgi:OFA family oxalate/formate antiporter-like MFS transporter|nr:MFS transporter [Bacteroidales bacterium]